MSPDPGGAPDPDPTERSPELRALADEYWEAVMVSSPTYATFVGDHRYDDRLDDLSATAESAHLARVERIASGVEAIDAGSLSDADQVTRGLLLAEVADARLRHDHHLAELASDQMTGAHADLLQLAPQTRAETPEQAAMLVDRYRQVDRYLAQAADRFRAGLDRGRPPAAVNIERSLNQVDGYLESPLDDDPFANLAGPDAWDGTAAWRAELGEVARDVIRPAFATYAQVLRDELLPMARSEDEPGLVHVEGGERPTPH